MNGPFIKIFAFLFLAFSCISQAFANCPPLRSGYDGPNQYDIAFKLDYENSWRAAGSVGDVISGIGVGVADEKGNMNPAGGTVEYIHLEPNARFMNPGAPQYDCESQEYDSNGQPIAKDSFPTMTPEESGSPGTNPSICERIGGQGQSGWYRVSSNKLRRYTCLLAEDWHRPDYDEPIYNTCSAPGFKENIGDWIYSWCGGVTINGVRRNYGVWFQEREWGCNDYPGYELVGSNCVKISNEAVRTQGQTPCEFQPQSNGTFLRDPKNRDCPGSNFSHIADGIVTHTNGDRSIQGDEDYVYVRHTGQPNKLDEVTIDLHKANQEHFVRIIAGPWDYSRNGRIVTHVQTLTGTPPGGGGSPGGGDSGGGSPGGGDGDGDGGIGGPGDGDGGIGGPGDGDGGIGGPGGGDGGGGSPGGGDGGIGGPGGGSGGEPCGGPGQPVCNVKVDDSEFEGIGSELDSLEEDLQAERDAILDEISTYDFLQDRNIPLQAEYMTLLGQVIPPPICQTFQIGVLGFEKEFDICSELATWRELTGWVFWIVTVLALINIFVRATTRQPAEV